MSQSELEKAASSLREVTEAIAVSEKSLIICKKDLEKTWLAYESAKRNLNDTQLLLGAQKLKQREEKGYMHTLLNGGPQDVYSNGLNEAILTKEAYHGR